MKEDPTLFELPEATIPDLVLHGTGAVRTHSGVTMEKILRASLHLLPGLVNGSAPVCPDAFTPSSTTRPVEIKSLRRKSKLVIYKWRINKDLPDTLYFIGIYKRKIGAKKLLDIWEGFSEHLTHCLILTKWDISRIIAEAELPINEIKMKKTSSGGRNGYQRKGYKDGYYSIPYDLLLPDLLELPFKAGCHLFHLSFSFTIHISNHALQLSQPN